MREGKSYVPPVQVGAEMRGGTVNEVVLSKVPTLKPGAIVGETHTTRVREMNSAGTGCSENRQNVVVLRLKCTPSTVTVVPPRLGPMSGANRIEEVTTSYRNATV